MRVLSEEEKDRNLNFLLETGVYETISPEKEMTVGEFLKELEIEVPNINVLVNGKRAEHSLRITPNDEVVIMPFVAGGA